MEDSLSIVFVMIVSLILMFLFPMIDSWSLQDNLSYVVCYAATVDFVDTARNTGYISQELYDAFLSKLLATGNTYDITLEHREFNEDLRAYLNTYTYEIMSDIENGIYDKNGVLKHVHKLDKQDYFYVTIKNTNRTQATILSDFFSSSTGTNAKIAVAYGGVVWSSRDEF